MAWWKDRQAPLALLAAFCVLYSALPLGTAVEMGGDEGFELSKGALYSRGFVLYKEIWSDQPPLLSVLLGRAFAWFGPSALVARLLAAGFGLLLFGAFYWAVSQRCGRWCGILAVFFLAASPVRQGVKQ
jgi:hypothetical protein